MRHPGSQCKNVKIQFKPEEAAPQDIPTLRPTRVGKSDRRAADDAMEPKAKKLPRCALKTAHEVEAAEGPEFVTDDSIFKAMMPQLEQLRKDTRGTRINPEPPRLVAKVRREEGMGELWLGPIPTNRRMAEIIQVAAFSIQIHCFKKSPEEQEIEYDGDKGEFLVDVDSFRCEMSNAQIRLADLRDVMTPLVNSLRQGDNGYVHCISGLSRAPVAAAIISAKLMGISYIEARDNVSKVRNVKIDHAQERKMQGPWINRLLREEVISWAVPTGFTCSTCNPNKVVVHATIMTEGNTIPVCRWKQNGQPYFKKEHHTVPDLDTAYKDMAGDFCGNCYARLKSPMKVKVMMTYGEIDSIVR